MRSVDCRTCRKKVKWRNDVSERWSVAGKDEWIGSMAGRAASSAHGLLEVLIYEAKLG